MYTASSAFLDALTQAGVSYIFANFGSDHPALIEAIAEARALNRKIPAIVVCPFEMVGLSAAHGYALVTGQPQAVVVHVDCGTQSLAGAVHNAAKGRAPVLIFAGLSPFTQDGELRGSRNEFIQWVQDVHDQPGIVREYMKYNNEFRTGRNIGVIVQRALQIARSDPQGPVYLVGAREVMEEELSPRAAEAAQWQPVSPGALPEDGALEIVRKLAAAERPLVVTSFLGRQPAAVVELVGLCETLGIGVLESVPSAMNFPHSHALYQGSQWNHPFQNQVLAEADVILILDSDVPWIPTVSRPTAGTPIYHIDVDPLKTSIPLWYIPATRSYRADAATALRQLRQATQHVAISPGSVARKVAHYGLRHRARAQALAAREHKGSTITVEYVLACLRAHAGNAIVLSEGITNYPQICDHMAPDKPGTYFASGGGSLGWNGGAAIGAKLAAPDRTVIAISGDGSFMFSVPSSVHWMANKLKTPFLQVVLNNHGWRAPRASTLAIHPNGYAAQNDHGLFSFDPSPDYSMIAHAAGNAHACRVENVDEVMPAIVSALRVVQEEQRTAVLDILLACD
jgi:acetolactate synthase I/II/III large subunit